MTFVKFLPEISTVFKVQAPKTYPIFTALRAGTSCTRERCNNWSERRTHVSHALFKTPLRSSCLKFCNCWTAGCKVSRLRALSYALSPSLTLNAVFGLDTKYPRPAITNCNLRLLHARTAYAAAPASLPPTATNRVTLSVVLLVTFCVRRMLRPALQ